MFYSSFRLVLALALLWAVTPTAALAPPVEVHGLRCDNGFPCPEEIRRRVDFWIKVFRSWTTEQVVLHDPRHTERVFSVVYAPEGCSRRGGTPEVERERARVRETLLRMADKRDRGEGDYTEEELAFFELFPGGDSAELRRAAAELRCQGGNRDRFAEALRRYGLYRTQVTRTLREHGLSEDIQFLPFVESAYNPRALSRVGAAGLWQIMPATARKLGLQLNAAVDERYDPQRSTQAAARYLSNSGARLMEAARAVRPDIELEQLSPFIITSYNYGIAGTVRALEQVGPDYVAMLRNYEAGGFGNAVKNFYASFLAARHVARFADLYFEEVVESEPLKTVTVPIRSAMSVADARRLFGVGMDELRELNPALTNNVWRGGRKIPVGYRLQLPVRSGGFKERLAKIEALPELPAQGKQRVEKDSTAAASERAVKEPEKETPPAPAIDREIGVGLLARVAREIERSSRIEAQGGTHVVRVQPEETLGHYADWLGIGSTQAIRKLNGIRDPNNIQPNTGIILPIRDAKQGATFEERRTEYHRALLDGLQERYDLIGTEAYKVKKNATLHSIAKEMEVPEWLLWRLNPGASRPVAGSLIEVPVLHARHGSAKGNLAR